jgi:rhodanese-related sulfurtransferase
LGVIVNQIRSDRLPLIADWSPEARLALKLGNKILISFDEARDTFFSGAAVFIDARPMEEYREGHIQGARSLHIGVFDEKAGEVLIDLPEDTLIITYCDGEKCTLSAELAQKLKQIGFENVRVLFNGWTVWKAHQLPTQVGEAQAS